MIETEREYQAALSRIAYWKQSLSNGQQSWLGQEQARAEIMRLHEQAGAYEKRARESSA